MEAPTRPTLCPTTAWTSYIQAKGGISSFKLSSAATSTILGGDVSSASILPSLRKALVPGGLDIREHHCSIFSEFSYGKDIWHVQRPVIYVVPQVIYNSATPDEVFGLVCTHFAQLLAEEDLRHLPIDASPSEELDRQEDLIQSIIARAEAEIRLFKPLGDGVWRRRMENQGKISKHTCD